MALVGMTEVGFVALPCRALQRNAQQFAHPSHASGYCAQQRLTGTSNSAQRSRHLEAKCQAPGHTVGSPLR